MEIRLTDAERARLMAVAADPSRLAIRARIVLACAQPGATNAQVSRDLGVSVHTVRKWRS
ncbi:IS630 family transposase, partial [Spongiactinospora rosea]